MNNVQEVVFGLLGGLAIFIYGMNLMSECLQKAAGERMKQILGLLTRNRLMGVLAGALVTAVLQSSSATTVMAIGFVSAGLMSLPQAISIIFGANIGTTITAQIIAFKITDYIYVFVFLGFLVAFLSKNEKVKNIGRTVFAFGLLFLGIETMGHVMKPLASSEVFTDMIAQVADIPILGVAVGTVMTLVVQSSSATIAVLQNFASQPGADGVSSIIGLAGAIPILLGDNIGTTITALLASIGQSRNAKRTAVAHVIFNISGALLFIGLVKPFASFIQQISTKGPEAEVIARQIANAHTVFNITMTLVWICLLGLMVKIVCRIVRDRKDEIVDLAKPHFLDRNALMQAQPAAALRLVAQEVIRCSDFVRIMLASAREAVADGNPATLRTINTYGDAVKTLHVEIQEYAAEIFSAGVLTEQQASQTAYLLYVLGDIERLGVLAAEIGASMLERKERKYAYSKEAMKDLEESLSYIEAMYDDVIGALTKGNAESLQHSLEQKEAVLDLDIKMRKTHMQRVSKGTCKKKLSVPFMQILHCIDRMGNSCVNLAEMAVDRTNFAYFTGTDADK